MNTQTLMPTQQSLLGASLSCLWKLDAGQAISMRPKEDGVLRVTQGGLYVTFDGPQRGAINSQDHFLRSGEEICVGAGRGLVIEPTHRNQRVSTFFSWIPLTGTKRAGARNDCDSANVMRDSFSELRESLALVMHALGRLGALARCKIHAAGSFFFDSPEPKAWPARSITARARHEARYLERYLDSRISW